MRDTLDEVARSVTRLVAPASLSLEDGNGREDRSSTLREVWTRCKGRPRAGDVILLRTRGTAYAIGRILVGQETVGGQEGFDHAVVVLKGEKEVLHVSPPIIRRLSVDFVLKTSRSPKVLRPRLTDAERTRFLQSLEMHEGKRYSLTQFFVALVGLSTKNMFNINPWALMPKAPRHERRSESLICTHLILSALAQTSCDFEKVLLRDKCSIDFDPNHTSSGSLQDFVQLHRLHPDLLAHVSTMESTGAEVDDDWLDKAGVEYVFVEKDSEGEERNADPLGWLGEIFTVSSLKRFGRIGILLDLLQQLVQWLVSNEDRAALAKLFEKSEASFHMENAFYNFRDRIFQNRALSTALYAASILLLLNRGRILLVIAWRVMQALVLRRVFLEVWREVSSSKI